MFEYVMTKKMYDAIIKSFKRKNISNPRQSVIDYVNSSFGLKNEVTDIHIKG